MYRKRFDLGFISSKLMTKTEFGIMLTHVLIRVREIAENDCFWFELTFYTSKCSPMCLCLFYVKHLLLQDENILCGVFFLSDSTLGYPNLFLNFTVNVRN